MFYVIYNAAGEQVSYVSVGDSVLNLIRMADKVDAATETTGKVIAPDTPIGAVLNLSVNKGAVISLNAGGRIEYVQIMDNGDDRVFKTYAIPLKVNATT